MPHARERDGIPSGAATGCNCRRFHNLFNAEQKRDDGGRLILRDPIREASLRAQTLGLAFRARQVIHGRQHKVIEKPTR